MEYWKFLHPNLAFAGRVWASGGLIRIDELEFLKRNRSRRSRARARVGLLDFGCVSWRYRRNQQG